MTEQLKIDRITSGYGPLQVLWDVSLSVGIGERVVLMGANGAGKTTLLKSLVGIIPVRSGTIALQGAPIHNLRTDRRIRHGLSYVSESGIIPSLTVQENLVIGGYSLDRAKLGQQLERIYQSFSLLKDKRRALGGSLSGGQRKILGLAKALMTEPQLLVMDEPSSGVSPVLTQEIVQMLQTFHQPSMAYLIAEQNTQFLQLADRVYVMESGHIRFSGTVDELHRNDALRMAYFGLEA